MKNIQRRHLLQGASALSLSACTPLKENSPSPMSQQFSWAQAEDILESTIEPGFPDADYDIRQFGATPGDASEAIHAAIKACHNAGGGRVIIPEGTYFTGPIHLESNVNLHLHDKAVLKFDTNPDRYLPAVLTRWEGVELMGLSPLIYAYNKNNVAITGKGTLDGQANRTTWWPWKGNEEWGVAGYPSQKPARDALFKDAETGVPTEQRKYAKNAYLRPPFIQPYRCKNVLIEDIRVVNAPFWLLNPVLCENVTVRSVHLESLGPNSDGCDPESCKNVVIENCFFDTGDDCIAIKSGRNNDGRRLATPTENVVIRNCKMRAGHGGIVIGSEISGGVRNVFAENNEMSSPDLDRGIRIKTNSVRGGVIENLYYRNNTIGYVKDAIVINFYYEEGDNGKFDPVVKNILIEELTCEEAERVFHIRGFKRAPIRNLNFSNCEFVTARSAGTIENVEHLGLNDVKVNGQDFKI